MRYCIREVAGWLLVALGLLTFYGCYELIVAGRPANAGALTVIGIFLFRGGIHLLKMAVAAQICQEAQARVAEQTTPPLKPAPALPATRFVARSTMENQRRARSF